MKNYDAISMTVLNRDTQVSLAGVHVTSQISGTAQHTEITQTFVNTEEENIEAVYTFPLPENAAVCNFEVQTAQNHLQGTVEESDDALDQYEEALATGDGAFMLDANRPDVFTINVGNLEPGEKVTILIGYVTEIKIVDASFRLEFPTCVGPRYVTDSGKKKNPLEIMADGVAVNPPRLASVPYGLSLDVRFDALLQLKSVQCPTHTIDCDRNESSWQLSLADKTTPMDRAVVLEATIASDQEPNVQHVLHPKTEEAFVAVTFVPEFDPEAHDLNNEIIFLIDCSGSMHGNSIEQAKRALGLCLKTMESGDRFNICRFGSHYEFMAKRSLPYNEETLRDALHYVDAMDSDLGGTEIHEPLKKILTGESNHELPRQVILLTDGQVSNEQAILKTVADNSKRNRIFSFGIGHAAGRFLVTEAARLSGGMAEFIAENERIETKVLRTFGRIASPCVESVKLSGGDTLELADPNLPPLFDGEATTILARVTGAAPKQIELRAKTQKNSYNWHLQVPQAPAQQTTTGQLWARQRIRCLETSLINDHNSAKKQELIGVSKRYGIVCQHTAYIAIEERVSEGKNTQAPTRRRIPVNQPAGQDLHFPVPSVGAPGTLACFSIAPSACPSPLPAPAAMSAPSGPIRRCKSRTRSAPAKKKSKGGLFNRLFGSKDSQDLSHHKKEAAPLPSSSGDPLFDLLQHQSAKGSFNQAPADASKQIRKALAKRSDWRNHTNDEVVNTVAVLSVLAASHADESDLWQRAARKAKKWLSQTTQINDNEIQTLILELSNTLRA